MINFEIDGRQLSVPKGTTVYNAAKQMGIEIPIFCYQDRMPPFGACRMCLVEVDKMSKLQTSCTLEATEGMVVRTQSSQAVTGREGILELLLINHPLDCPICDKGGECPLQDQVLKFGPGLSRFFEEKRRFKKALELGPVLMLDRERCIVCARCTRFGDIVAGDHALEFIERGYRTEVGTPDGEPVKSKFIGNTIEICPVGALTSNVYRFRARPWDNDSTNSTCTLCPVGCSVTLDSRDGEIMRTRSCENRSVNDMWLCDKGWFGYEFTTNEKRLQTPLIRRNGRLEPATWDEALALVAEKMQEAKPEGKLAAWGGNPLTVEENYLFQKLMRSVIGVNHVDHRIGMPLLSLDEEGIQPGMEISIGDCDNLSYVVLLGLDITEEFPIIWLRLRQALIKGAKIIYCGHYAPEITNQLSQTIVHAPGEEIETIRQQLSIASLAGPGKKGALFVGQQYLNTPQRKAILAELKAMIKTTPDLSLNVLEGCGNSVGARLAGMRPDHGPFNIPLPQPGLNYLQVAEETAKNGWDLLYVAGANPAVKMPTALWKEMRAKLKFLVVQDLFLTETAQHADVVLPTASYVEKSGHFINIERRVQKLFRGKNVPLEVYNDSEIFTFLAHHLNVDLMIDAQFARMLESEFIPKSEEKKLISENVGRVEVKRNEGELAATFSKTLFDHGVRMQHNVHLVKASKEPRIRIHPEEAAKRGVKDNDSVRVSAGDRFVLGKVQIDARVAKNTAVLPLGYPEFPVHDLGALLYNGMCIELSKH
jgi:NADH-quinone oxidoreductase subunit G